LHTGGADLDAITVPGKSKAQSPVLKVKSYAFYLACIKMNYPSLANMHANGNISNQTVLISTT
jgi:hypothetical protein